MHPQVLQWIGLRAATSDPVSVLDIGGRDINGTVRELFPAARFTSLDLYPHPSVDIVADAAEWRTDERYDIVTCTEVFEHTDHWRDICRTAYAVLRPGGAFAVTCAAPGRGVHSGIDGQWRLLEGETYGEVSAVELREALEAAGFVDIITDQQPSPPDTRGYALKPKEAI